jgi:hypothetical protein
MRLTKTQQYLLDQAKARGGAYAVETGAGRGAKGGRIRYGARERDALFKLEAAGLVRVTWRQGDSWWTGNGNSVHGTVIAFELVAPMPTDADYLAALGPCGK